MVLSRDERGYLFSLPCPDLHGVVHEDILQETRGGGSIPSDNRPLGSTREHVGNVDSSSRRASGSGSGGSIGLCQCCQWHVGSVFETSGRGGRIEPRASQI
jgi:hypothetical protein